MSSAPVLVVGDLHLGPRCPPETAHGLGRLLLSHPECDLVFLGDTFDLSLAPEAPAAFLVETLARTPGFVEALRAHLELGRRVCFVTGNHDAELVTPNVKDALEATFPDGGLEVVPWFVRRHGAHLEHGHLWDPDNAPTHPLVVPPAWDQPLGVALTREVVAQKKAQSFAHAHESTPLAALRHTLAHYRWQAFAIIGRFFSLALISCARALVCDRRALMVLGDRNLAGEAAREGVAPEELRRALSLRPRPRHLDFSQLWTRLYLDRAGLTLALVLGVLGAVIGPGRIYFGLLALLAAAALGLSIAWCKARYRGLLVARLANAGRGLSRVYGGRLVVMSHSHVADRAPGYLNVGSFGYPSRHGRPYGLLEPSGEATVRYVEPG